MELSILLGQLFGIAFVAIGLGMIINSKYYIKAYDALLKEVGLIMFGGIFALVVGFLIVTRHWVWEGWPILITIFGLMGLLKGVLLLIFPNVSLPMFKKWFTKTFVQVQGVGALILGLILCYFSLLS